MISKPCPYCGFDKPLMGGDGIPAKWFVYCPKCNLSGPYNSDEKEAYDLFVSISITPTTSTSTPSLEPVTDSKDTD